MTTLSPYLNFDGKTEEAMKFYAEVLGGSLDIHRLGDSPMPVPAEFKNRIMHATLRANAITLMASDTMPGQTFTSGSQVHLSLNFDDPAAQDEVWGQLAAGGTVTMPLGDQFFGRFGMLVDKFGIQWMLHYQPAQPAQTK
jgi:PhnB protein